MLNLKRRIVLTGATRGLGAAMLEGFIASGAIVHGCGTNSAAVEQLKQAYPGPHTFHVVDVTDSAQIKQWADSVLPEGAPDLLINNAALINTPAKLWDLPASEWRRMFDVNVLGMVEVLRAFLPAMVAQQKGVVVNFSSAWGRTTSADVSAYCATKFAVEGLTRSLAQELPKGMAAVALNPGIIATDMLAQVFRAGASAYPTPAAWAKRSVPYILGLGARDNGASADVPGG
ncbi:MAG: SDR family NAD(P)-dependent oxidoreductase [Planctomycetota bacterium]|nr:SDR family NAD(P)-dependent oxidoreductase [Planctomycetota bacterium]